MSLVTNILFLGLTSAVFLIVPQVSIASSSVFPSCVNISNRADISYSDGTHGIAGDTSTYTGSDSVYKLNGNSQVLQCFCGSNGQGIQTNWIRKDGLSSSEIASLQEQGWILVAYGSDWGLDNAAYLARNTAYSCLGTATIQSAAATNNAAPSATSSIGNALVELADTGNSFILATAIFLGIFSMISGIIVHPGKE